MRNPFKRRGSFIWLVAMALALGVNVATAAEPAPSPPPFDVFKGSLKQVEGRFLLNGNWVSEEDLKKIWDRKEAQDKSYPGSRDPNNSEASTPLKYVHPDLSLNVNLIKGELDFWARSQDRLLSYAIDRSSMTAQEHETVKRAMAEAADDWEKACPQCGIKFEYKREFDLKPSFTKVRFIVRKTGTGGGTPALSFFPSTPSDQRFITVTPDFFKDGGLNQAGVFRHNLGHVLGYRHEHISPEAGPDCITSEPPTFITGSYDPKSVMHYLCGGGGTKDMRLSERDITSHQLLYGFATIQVDIEGKNVLNSVARIMSEIGKVYSRLPFGIQHIGTSDGCRAYLKDLGLLEVLASENIQAPKACSVFASLARNVDGESQFPLLPFNRTTDFASGAALNTDREAFREFVELRDRVNPFNLNTVWRPSGVRYDTKIFNYEMEWNRYTANIPVSPLELPPVRNALRTLSDKNPNIKISVDDAIGKSLTLQRAVKQNAVVHPIEGLDAICLPGGDSFGAYPMMLDGNLEKPDFEDKISGPNNTGIPQLRCDVPEENQAVCNSCGNGKCGSEACSACGVCRKASAVIIDESIDPESLSYPAVTPTEPICKWKPFEARHHGTLMAQIVAGSNKFVGFMPDLDLKFVKYDAKVPAPTFDADLSAKLREQRAGVAIVTNQFCYPGALMKDFIKDLPTGSSLCEIKGDVRINAAPGDRQRLLAQHLPTKRIRNARDWFWVAAIGQPAGVNRVLAPPSPTTFDEFSIASPIVLADKSNVMLVSACEKCSVQRKAVDNRRNWSSAHRGKGAFRPHVIAPGGIEAREKKNGEWIGGVPGFGVGKEPVRAYGTSQAAAYVGGLATKMLACYPSYYGAPSRLKEAIQFTSMPVLPDGDEEDTVTTGLVDVRAALRNPGFAYFKDDGEGEGQFARIPRNKFNWCSSSLNFKQPGGGQTDEIPVENIRRIVQIPIGAAARWVVYYRKAGDDGSVQDGAIFKSPLYAGIQTPPDSPETIFSSNGQNKTLSDIQDLLLFDEFGPGPCLP